METFHKHVILIISICARIMFVKKKMIIFLSLKVSESVKDSIYAAKMQLLREIIMRQYNILIPNVTERKYRKEKSMDD